MYIDILVIPLQRSLLLNNMVHPPLPHAVEEAALDAATADDDGHQDEYKADENES